MTSISFSAVCALGLLALTSACTAGAGDDHEQSDDALSAAGFPEGEPIVPPYLATVTPGTFTLTRSFDQPDPGSFTVLEIVGHGNGGTATVTTRSTTTPLGLPEGEPIAPPFASARTYALKATSTACGKVYTGTPAVGAGRITIQDFREMGPACPAIVAGPLSAQELQGDVMTNWYGKLFEAPTAGVWTNDATSLRASTGGGGFTPPAPPGSECMIGAADYQLTIATRRLVWETCQFKSWSEPLTKSTGSRVITPEELAKVVSAVKATKVTTDGPCGADKPLLRLTVTSPSRSVTYADDFHSCSTTGPFIANIDGVFGAFRAAAGE